MSTVSTELPDGFGRAGHERVRGLVRFEASLVADGGDLAARVLIEEAVDLRDQFRSQLQNRGSKEFGHYWKWVPIFLKPRMTHRIRLSIPSSTQPTRADLTPDV